MHRSIAHCLGLLIFITVVSGCQVTAARRDEGDIALSRAGNIARPDVPPGLDPALLAVREGKALERAGMTLDQIVAALPMPPYLEQITLGRAESVPSGATGEPIRHVPLEAQQAYVRARYYWHQRKNFEAIRQLDRALTLAPDQPEILRLLGRLYFASGNQIRGAMILKKAIALDPTGLETLFLLGKHEFEQGNHAAAISGLAYAISLDPGDADPALLPLLHFYLGSALGREGYDRATIQQYANDLDLSARFYHTTGLLRELHQVYRQRGFLWRAVGDAHHRLGEPRAALQAYERAAEQGALEPAHLLRRLLFTQICLGRHQDAQHTLVAHIRQFPDDKNWHDVVHYLARHGVQNESLGDELEVIYQQLDRPPQLAVVVAQLLAPNERIKLLRSHLRARPNDRVVLAFLLRQLFPKHATLRDALAAIGAVADAIEALPVAADRYATLLVETVAEPDLLREAIALLPAYQRERSSVHYIGGVVSVYAKDVDQAIVQFEEAAAGDQGFVPARLALAQLLIQEKKLDRAEQVLEPLAGETDPFVQRLRVQILAESDRVDDALRLVDQILTERYDDAELLLIKAELQLVKGDSLGAHQSLVDAVNADPTAEAAYQALFNLYRSRRGPPGVDYRNDLMRKLRRYLPFSRLYRLQHAEELANRQEYAPAEELLRGLLAEDANDYPALDLLSQMLLLNGQEEQARQLLEQRLSGKSADRDLLAVAQRFYLRSKNLDRAYEITERLLLLEEDTPRRTILLAAFYLHELREPQKAKELIISALANPGHEPDQLLRLLGRALHQLGQVEEFEKFVRIAMNQFPQKQADLAFEWAMFCERQGEPERAEQIMVDQLREAPKHAGLNNGLGYTWADQGRNLDRAKEMIQLALDAEPDNGAFLDSMGWVHYKLGDFPDAVLWLKRASHERDGEHPVILDHLGDALFQAGQHREAQKLWHQAYLVLKQMGTDDDPELQDLELSLRLKLEAIKNDREPPLASSPGARKSPVPGPLEEEPNVAPPANP